MPLHIIHIQKPCRTFKDSFTIRLQMKTRWAIAFRILTALTIGGSLVACANSFLIQDYPVKYELKQFNGLMVSNWSSRDSYPQSKTKNGTLTITYPFIVENVNKGKVTLAISDAHFAVFGKSLGALCKSSLTVLSEGQKTKINCIVELNKEQAPELAQADTFGELRIPFQREMEKNPAFISLSFKIKIEDLNQ